MTALDSAAARRGVDPLATRSWVKVPLDAIDADNLSYQFRLSFRTADVCRSLEEEGQREPIDLLGPAPHRIVDGFRRVAAAKELGWTTIKAFVHEGLSDEDAFRLAFTKNVVRRNLGPLEKANAMYVAQQRGVGRPKLAELFGLSEKQVTRYLALLEFPEPIQKVLDGKHVTMAHAKALAEFRVADADEWAQRIRDEELGVPALKRALKQALGKKVPGRKKLYMKKDRTGIRFYPFAVKFSAGSEEKQKIVDVLERALEAIKESM